MKKILSLYVLLLSALTSLAQTPTLVGYLAVKNPTNGQQQVINLYSDGSRRLGTSLPSDAAFARIGGTVRLPYAPEANAKSTPEQFGLNKQYSPTYWFSVDSPTSGSTVAQRQATGVNLFNPWMLTDAQKQSLPFGKGQIYLTEAGVHGIYERRGLYEIDLATYEAYVFPRLIAVGNTLSDPGVQVVIFNIETSLYWARDSYTDAEWNAGAKDKQITLESSGNNTKVTLQQLNDSGQWATEARVRLLNRGKLLQKMIKFKSAKDASGLPLARVSWGASPFQGVPDISLINNPSNVFISGNGDVSHIGGINQTIILNGHTYTNMGGGLYDDEDFTTGYFYNFNAKISQSDYNDIFVNKIASTQNYPYLWSKLGVEHVVAREKGYIQANWLRQTQLQGKRRGILRQDEIWYEGSTEVVNQGFLNVRIPFAGLQGVLYGGETPKISKAPHEIYSEYIVSRFLAGNEPNYGFYMFPEVDANKLLQSPASIPELQKPLHYVTQLYQARNDLQPWEFFYTNSTLVEDPEVQISQTGDWSAYSGAGAYAVDGGKHNPQKPCYILRYKPTQDGWRVVIVGGFPQGWTESRTDNIRVPNGGLNGNTFTVQLNGPTAQVFEFFVKSTDSNQNYKALFARNTSWERAGYAGRVGTTSTTTNPTTNTAPTTGTTALRYNFDSNNLLTFEGQDNVQTLTFSGNGFPTVPNPDGIPLSVNYPYGSKPLYGQSPYTKQWQLYHAGTVSLVATLTGGSTLSYTITPTVGDSHIGLTGTPGTTTNTGTTTNSNTGSSNSSTTAYKPSAETYSYPTIVGSKSWPEYDTRQITYQPSGITKAIGEKASLDNGKIHIEVWKTYSGVAHISKSGTNLNLVNQNTDNGRGIDLTLYFGGTVVQNPPKEIGKWGNGKSVEEDQGGAGVGYDPITTGDYFNNSSKTLDFTTDGQTIYLKTQLVNWNVNNDLTDVIVEKWIYLDDIACRVNYRITCNRAGEKQQYEARSNEFPNFYAVGRLRYLAYADGNGNIQYTTNGDQTRFTIGERWLFASPDQNANSQGVGLTRSVLYSTVQTQHPGGDTEFEGGSNHFNAEQHVQWDWNTVFYGNHAYMVGTVDQIRQYALAQPDPYNKISWKFNSTNNRGLFWFHNCKDTGFPTPNDGMAITTKVDGNYELNWPEISINPATVQNIVIRYKATPGTGTASLFFGHPGQADIQVAAQEIQFPTTFITDGQPHSMIIPVSNAANWNNGKISRLYVQFHNSSQSSTQTIQWINTTDTDPEP